MNEDDFLLGKGMMQLKIRSLPRLLLLLFLRVYTSNLILAGFENLTSVFELQANERN